MLTLATLAAVALLQGPDFSWSGSLAAGKELTIKNVIGDIRVEGASGGRVEITAVKRAGRRGDPDDVTIRRVETSRGVELCVIYPNNDDRGDDCDFDRGGRGNRNRDRSRRRDENDTRVAFTVRLPHGVNLQASTVSGDVQATSLRGLVNVATVSGEILVRDAAGTLVEATSVSGDVQLVNIRADQVAAETVSGDVEYQGEIRPRGEYDFQTLSGDVVLRVPRGLGAEISASTFSGSIRSSFEITTREDRRSRWTNSRRLTGTIGDGGAQLRLQSFSGSVELLEMGGRN